MATSNRTSSVIAAWRVRPVEARPGRDLRERPEASWLQAGAVAVLVVAWLLAIFTVDRVRFVVLAPTAKTGFEVILALGQLFGALVLALFPDESVRPRLRWVALGLAAFGLGAFGFGYVAPLARDGLDLNASLFGATVVRWAGCGMVAVGLALGRPPRLPGRAVLALVVAFAAVSVALVGGAGELPRLIEASTPEAVAGREHAIMDGLTPAHWGLALVPFLLASIAAVGAARHFPGRELGGWLVVAVALLAGAQLHTIFWPSAYSAVLTTSSLLRLGFTAVVVVGGVLELRRVAAERARLLVAARESARHLTDLAVLRADFTAMVAHELGSPIAAIRRSSELLALEPLGGIQRRAVATIEAEVGVLQSLVGDVLASSKIERDAFAVRPRPEPVRLLLAEAAAFARTLPGEHPFAVVGDDLPDRVMADAQRIGQVLRNLLGNATRYTPAGTPIELRASPRDGRIRIEVADRGPGIQPDDVVRIFEKFGRGRDESGRGVAGVGLGLYLSRGIVRAHGGELAVASTPGRGATFAFELAIAR